MTTGETLTIIGIVASPVVGGVTWTVYKVITHDAWLEHIKATVERIEAKLDRLVEHRES